MVYQTIYPPYVTFPCKPLLCPVHSPGAKRTGHLDTRNTQYQDGSKVAQILNETLIGEE